MKLLLALTYYHPHISGLTVYVERLAEALAARGHAVTVLTSRHDPSLALEETRRGVRIVRVPVAFRVGKGALMPSYLRRALPLVREHDLCLLNLPATPVEATTIPLIARFLARRPSVALYHCDLRLPEGLSNRIAERLVSLNNYAAGLLLNRIVATTEDYAEHSPFLRRFKGKLAIIRPAVRVETARAEEVEAFRRAHAPGGEPLVGFAARFSSEKGVEYLLDALPQIQRELPGAKILFTGDPRKVVGEESYQRRMQPRLAQAADACVFLGALDWRAMAVFYAACDVTVLPSLNSTESFGLAQLESMLAGTPVVVSNLPGLRVPVQTTGMGRIVPPRDSRSIAEAVVDVIRHKQRYARTRADIEGDFSFDAMLGQYEELFEQMLSLSKGR
ncbi:MAG TPA: glycosyltransferase family 4 protein [Pyrinomonadaceae bacterium]|jgi:glycosyltransferase involved in cell wall biosynthesis